MFHSETIKFFRQTGRRRGKSHGSFSGKQKEQRDLCRRGALPVGSDFMGDQRAQRRHKGPESWCSERRGWRGRDSSGGRLPPVRGEGPQEPVLEGLWVEPSLSSAALSLPGAQDRRDRGGGATSRSQQKAVLSFAKNICSLASGARH